ncbi:MAG TPA: lasso peptide biosynthesis B2 protein [Candidatus Acidoferrum sp.]|nr:lasso peptide biosynthesis B2 protein [Candidatus Acidoferrum sp.]
MWARLRRFSALPGAAKSDFVEAALLLPWIRLSLRLRGFRATQKSLLERANPAAAALPETAAAALTEQVCRIVLAASRHSLLRTTCLERSLTLWRLLARRGVTSQLRIGTSKCEGKFAAHAWVERNGEAIGEPEGTHLHYAAFEKEFGGEIR